MSKPRFDVTLRNINSDIHPLKEIVFRFVGLTQEESVERAIEIAGEGFVVKYIHAGLKKDITED